MKSENNSIFTKNSMNDKKIEEWKASNVEKQRQELIKLYQIELQKRVQECLKNFYKK